MVRTWTDEEAERLPDAWRSDATSADLEQMFGRSYKAIANKVFTMGLRACDRGQGSGTRPGPRPSWTDDEKQRLRSEWEAGTRLEDLAEILGRSIAGIRHTAYSMGLPRRAPTGGHIWTEQERDVVIRGYARGLSRKEIAAQLGMTTNQVAGAAIRMGLKYGEVEALAQQGDDDDEAPPVELTIAARVTMPAHNGCAWPTLTAGGVSYCCAETDGHFWCAEHRALHLRPVREEVDA